MVSQNGSFAALLFHGLENQIVGSLQSSKAHPNLFGTQAGRQGCLFQQRGNAISQRVLWQVPPPNRLGNDLEIIDFSSTPYSYMAYFYIDVIFLYSRQILQIMGHGDGRMHLTLFLAQSSLLRQIQPRWRQAASLRLRNVGQEDPMLGHEKRRDRAGVWSAFR